MTKQRQKNKRFQSLQRTLKNEEKQLNVEMAFLESVKPLFDAFLKTFQAEGPLIHFLYPSLLELLKMLMKRFVKNELVVGKSGSELVKIDVSKSTKQLSDSEIDIGTPCRKALASLNTNQQ